MIETPLYYCPKCKKKSPTWDLRNVKCNNCGYSLMDSFVTPSIYQEEKYHKHTFGGSTKPENNWIFHPELDQHELVKYCANLPYPPGFSKSEQIVIGLIPVFNNFATLKASIPAENEISSV